MFNLIVTKFFFLLMWFSCLKNTPKPMGGIKSSVNFARDYYFKNLEYHFKNITVWITNKNKF